MTTKECVKVLRRFNTWRNGRGKKYAIPGVPIHSILLNDAINKAIEVMSSLPKPDDINPKPNAKRRVLKFVKAISDEQTQ
jgi:hypothetical protein